MQPAIQNCTMNMFSLKRQFRTGSGNGNGKRKVSSIQLLLVAGLSVGQYMTHMRPKLCELSWRWHLTLRSTSKCNYRNSTNSRPINKLCCVLCYIFFLGIYLHFVLQKTYIIMKFVYGDVFKCQNHPSATTASDSVQTSLQPPRETIQWKAVIAESDWRCFRGSAISSSHGRILDFFPGGQFKDDKSWRPF